MSRGGAALVLGLPGPRLDSSNERILERVRPAGMILFARNIESVDQVRELTARLRELLPDVVVFVDAEGGTVDRLRALVGPAPGGDLLARRPVGTAERAGRWIGQSLRTVDLDVDFAPVVDLDRSESGNALDGRYLGRTPRAVTARGRAFLRGLHAAGVGGCIKHFPGLGAAGEDTHDEPARIDLGRAALRADLEPFRGLLGEARMVMMAHASYPALDPEERPASLSPPIVGGLLRDELSFDGLVVSDDLDMRALEPWGGLAARAARALEAGCDAIPICRSTEAAVEVANRLGHARYRDRLAEAVGRWAAYRAHLATLRAAAPRFALETVRRRLEALR